MKNLLTITALLALAAGAATATAQNTPRGVEKQARADRKMERAHTIRHGESLSKEPRLVREEDKLDHRKMSKRKAKM